MKYKILALAVTAALVTGCSDSNDDVHSMKVQAFDPAVRGMTLVVNCGGDDIKGGITNDDGYTTVTDGVASYSPETCMFTFTGGVDAKDKLTGVSMTGVEYIIPKGLAAFNVPVTASPLTTLVAKKLKDKDLPYSEEAARLILVDLGLGTMMTNNNITTNEMLTNTEKVMKDLGFKYTPSTTKSVSLASNAEDLNLMGATTSVLSSALTAGVDLDKITLSVQNTAKEAVDAGYNPNDVTTSVIKVTFSSDGTAPPISIEEGTPPAPTPPATGGGD